MKDSHDKGYSKMQFRQKWSISPNDRFAVELNNKKFYKSL